MKVQYISRTLIDCFWDEGWLHQARVKLTNKKPVILSATSKIPDDFYQALNEALERQQGNNRG